MCKERKSCPFLGTPHPPPARKAEPPQTVGWGVGGQAAAGQGAEARPCSGGLGFRVSVEGGCAGWGGTVVGQRLQLGFI